MGAAGVAKASPSAATNVFSTRAVDAPKTGLKVERYEPPVGIIEQVETISRRASLDVGGIEYLVDDRDGKHYFYDINALSNFVADPVNVLGFDPWRSLVDYLLERAGVPKQDALKPESTIRRAARETAAALASAVISAPALP